VLSFLMWWLSGLAFALVVMVALWQVALRIDKISIVDPGWAGIIMMLVLAFGMLSDGYDLRRFLITFMGVMWGARLTYFILFRRVIGKGEDPRYTEWIRKWGADKDRKMREFFLIQAGVAAFFSFPYLLISRNWQPSLSAWEILGFLIWIIAFTGEAAADIQLELFKGNPENKGKTCRCGLWNYSRHPNYFFEFLIWVSVAVFALGSPYGWVTIICPAIMFYFLFKVTGIPKAEEQSLRSRGDDYREYQRTTSLFVPWFKKKQAPHVV